MKKLNNKLLLIFCIIILSCNKLIDSEPTWGCTDINACNYNPLVDYNDDCIYPEYYDECCDGQVIDRCGECGGDNSSCLSFDYYNSFQYFNSECLGDSIEFVFNNLNLAVIDHENLVLTGSSQCNLEDSINYNLNINQCDSLDGNWIPNLIFSNVDSVINSIVYLKNYFFTNNDTISYSSTFNSSGTLFQDSTIITLVSNNQYGCQKHIFSTINKLDGSKEQECCNYNQFALFNSDCEFLDCDGICDGPNQPD